MPQVIGRELARFRCLTHEVFLWDTCSNELNSDLFLLCVLLTHPILMSMDTQLC